MKASIEISRCIRRSLCLELPLLLSMLVFLPAPCAALAGQFEQTIQPLIADHCVHCHEGSDAMVRWILSPSGIVQISSAGQK